MPISDKAIKDLPLGKDVEKAINDCIQDWEGAIEWSIDHLPDPPVGFSWLDWSIGLVGNMLWAVTVFFPPAFAIATPMEVARGGVVVARIEEKLVFASASAATKAASVLGAAIGSSGTQIGGVLRALDGELNSPEGKKFIHKFMMLQIGPMYQKFVDDADDWAQKNLLNHLIARWSLKTKPDRTQDNDDSFREFYNSAVGSSELRRYVWEKFVFPVDDLAFDKQKQGLEDFLLVKLQEMADDYATQWKAYQVQLRKSAGTGAGANAPRDFQPVIKFDGIPQDLQAMYETNRKKIAYTVSSTMSPGRAGAERCLQSSARAGGLLCTQSPGPQRGAG
jgi:hypothetical protein